MTVELTPRVLDDIWAWASEAIGPVPPDPLAEHVPMDMEAYTVLALVAAARERDALRATVARVEALRQRWENEPPQGADSYLEGRDDQLDFCEQQLLQALRGEDQ